MEGCRPHSEFSFVLLGVCVVQHALFRQDECKFLLFIATRFKSSPANEFSSIGFRVIWTAVWIPQTTHDIRGNVVSRYLG